MKEKILIIGYKDTEIRSFEWYEEIPLLTDFDIVIFNTESLPDDYSVVSSNFELIRKELTKYIILQKKIIILTSPQGDKTYSKLEFLPGNVIIIDRVSEALENLKNSSLGDYVKDIKKSDHRYSFQSASLRFSNVDFLTDHDAWILTSDRSPIACEFFIYNNKFKSNFIYLLPLLTNVGTGDSIKKIIDVLTHANTIVLPEWVNNIALPGEENMKEIINNSKKIIRIEKEKIKHSKEKLSDLNKFKGLVTLKDFGLEKLVKDALELIGFQMNETKKTEEDLVIVNIDSGLNIPVEIGGFNKHLKKKKINQIMMWMNEYDDEASTVGGVLIVNTMCDTQLDEDLNRDIGINSNLVKQAESLGIKLINTIDLLKLLIAKLEGRDVSLYIKDIFETPGLFNFD